MRWQVATTEAGCFQVDEILTYLVVLGPFCVRYKYAIQRSLTLPPTYPFSCLSLRIPRLQCNKFPPCRPLANQQSYASLTLKPCILKVWIISRTIHSEGSGALSKALPIGRVSSDHLSFYPPGATVQTKYQNDSSMSSVWAFPSLADHSRSNTEVSAEKGYLNSR